MEAPGLSAHGVLPSQARGRGGVTAPSDGRRPPFAFSPPPPPNSSAANEKLPEHKFFSKLILLRSARFFWLKAHCSLRAQATERESERERERDREREREREREDEEEEEDKKEKKKEHEEEEAIRRTREP